MERSAIDRDLKGAQEEDILTLVTQISSLNGIPVEACTPETDARLAHLLMVQAHKLCQGDKLPPEIKTFYAAISADRIASEAVTVAMDKGELAELSASIDAVRRREGLTGDEEWRLGEGPADYRQLEAKAGRVIDRITDTIFAYMLRRYRLEEHAELFERDRVAFEIQREVGHRVLYGTGAERLMDKYFRETYGAAALRRVKLRTKQLRAEKA